MKNKYSKSTEMTRALVYCRVSSTKQRLEVVASKANNSGAAPMPTKRDTW